MSQLNLGDKVRLLYDQLKDIKYTLATVADMSNRPLEEYGQVIEESIGRASANKSGGNVKMYTTSMVPATSLLFEGRPAYMSGSHDICIKPEITKIGTNSLSPLGIKVSKVNADLSDVIYGMKIVGEPISCTATLDLDAVGVDMSLYHHLDINISIASTVQEGTND